MEFLIFILICYGASNIVVFSSIFEWLRVKLLDMSPKFLGKLSSCMMCSSFWFGALASLTVYSPTMMSLGVTSIIFSVFLDGCLASGSVWLIHTIQEAFEK